MPKPLRHHKKSGVITPNGAGKPAAQQLNELYRDSNRTLNLLQGEIHQIHNGQVGQGRRDLMDVEGERKFDINRKQKQYVPDTHAQRGEREGVCVCGGM